MYDYCNEKLFNNELGKPVITVQLDSKNKTYGWFTPAKVWKWTECVNRLETKNFEEHELNITAQELHRPIGEIAATMIHEMVHFYAETNNLQDTSRSNTYHNKLFKKLAEAHGLKVECVQTYGWSHTELTDETAAFIAEFIKDNPETLIYRSPVFKGQTVKTTSTRKYVCPICGISVRATKRVNIQCMNCIEPMTVEE